MLAGRRANGGGRLPRTPLTFGLSPPEASLSLSGCELSLSSCSSAELTTRPAIL